MPIDVSARFSFELSRSSDVLLQFEAAAIPEQRILSSECRMSDAEAGARVPAHDTIGERVWIRCTGQFEVDYSARIEVRRILADMATLTRLDLHRLPGETIEYLFDSRYCPASRFAPFVEAEFAGCDGGARVAAICEWIARRFTYQPGCSTPATTAVDSFLERRGVCRDYAHVLIALVRASAIPARYVSAYAPGVDPPDFHALAEVFLADPATPGGGVWHLVDATRMADPGQTVKIGVGRDAADVSFMTVFGQAEFGDKLVTATLLP